MDTQQTASTTTTSWFKYNVGNIGLTIIFCFYVYYEQTHKTVEKPSIPTLSVEAKAYHDSMGQRFYDLANKIKSNEINSKEEIIAFLSDNANNMAKAIDELVDSNVDKSNGKIVNRQPLVDGFKNASENLGVKTK